LTVGGSLEKMNAMRRKKVSPPKSQRKTMRCCCRFVEKVESAIPHGELVRTFDGLGLPRNLLKRWREGSVVRLDYAWLLARQLGVTLDSLADDELSYPAPREASRSGEMIPGQARTAGPMERDQDRSGGPNRSKKRARNNNVSRHH
jgi:hypothetical protein